MRLIQFVKNWTLPIAMALGAAGYFVYTSLSFLGVTRPWVNAAVTVVQPLLIFAMLFITFCKVDPRKLRPCRWHFWLLLFQAAGFVLPGLLLAAWPDMPGRVVVEGAMLCLICPTATAAVVVTSKLGGNAERLTTYTILVNLLTACVVPLLVPVIHPHPGQDFLHSLVLILYRVFPLLFCPFLAALFVRRYLLRLQQAVLACKDLAFYLWAVALALAIAVTMKSIVHSTVSFVYQAGIAGISLVCCMVQFALGRFIGGRYNDAVSAGQALGQKNTVFAIWMGYTFMTPVTSVAGGFYSIWHNVFNSYQLYRKRQKEQSSRKVL